MEDDKGKGPDLASHGPHALCPSLSAKPTAGGRQRVADRHVDLLDRQGLVNINLHGQGRRTTQANSTTRRGREEEATT